MFRPRWGFPRSPLGCRPHSRALTHFVGLHEMIRCRVAQSVEELSAAMRMPPALGVDTFHVVAQVQELGPLFSAGIGWFGGAGDMCLSAVREFELRSLATIRACNEQHGIFSVG